VPGVSVFGNHDEGEEPGRRELLAVHELRRSVERIADGSTWWLSVAMTALHVISELRELIEALDRRVPQVERAGEASIAHDAAVLKARALQRIEELEAQNVARTTN